MLDRYALSAWKLPTLFYCLVATTTCATNVQYLFWQNHHIAQRAEQQLMPIQQLSECMVNQARARVQFFCGHHSVVYYYLLFTL